MFIFRCWRRVLLWAVVNHVPRGTCDHHLPFGHVLALLLTLGDKGQPQALQYSP